MPASIYFLRWRKLKPFGHGCLSIFYYFVPEGDIGLKEA
jgi:hypothetical protein